MASRGKFWEDQWEWRDVWKNRRRGKFGWAGVLLLFVSLLSGWKLRLWDLNCECWILLQENETTHILHKVLLWRSKGFSHFAEPLQVTVKHLTMWPGCLSQFFTILTWSSSSFSAKMSTMFLCLWVLENTTDTDNIASSDGHLLLTQHPLNGYSLLEAIPELEHCVYITFISPNSQSRLLCVKGQKHGRQSKMKNFSFSSFFMLFAFIL